jgi:oxygen-dependent protoporphyrinogen oxidase
MTVAAAPVVIVGGGVAGLTIARALTHAGVDALVLEAASHPGGLLRSERREGYLCDWAANAFLAGEPGGAVDLCRELGVDIVEAAPAAKRRYIFRGGARRLVPTSPPVLAKTDLLSWRGKLRLLAEPLVRARAANGAEDETIDAFFRRRVGVEAAEALVAPFTLGVFAGESDALSMRAAFPRFAALEARHGGLVRGMLGERRLRQREGRAPAQPARLWAPRQGASGLVDALARELGERVRTGVKVVAIERRAGGGQLLRALDSSGAPVPPIAARTLVLATPAAITARLCESLDDELARLALAIPSPPVLVAFAGFAQADVPAHAADGFGLLVARGEAARVLGIVFESVVWPERAPPGHALFRMIYGGGRDPDVSDLFDDELHTQALADLAHVLGIQAAPRFFHVVRHAAGIPQYTPGHIARVEEASRRAAALGITLAGNAWRAVSVTELVREAPALAERLR